MRNPKALAAELRLRALDAEPQEQAELLFLAAEYENLADTPAFGGRPDWLGVPLPN
ncbi:hypothetical protein GGC65_003744 [Sphingopyxis sp. OAS728]|uniref:hypothetical protein n=1 Tax=Sphingopyxis sp. OAS728 TaxID=2663823 RepID=UPI0017892FB0|nr:hypothetical protein [Sphingopyxis sp. OAS728]MBE1529288.1 hypothetical protein [Sphingopyxis sp. OAS728]